MLDAHLCLKTHSDDPDTQTLAVLITRSGARVAATNTSAPRSSRPRGPGPRPRTPRCTSNAFYPLQGAHLARAKHRTDPDPSTPWYQAPGAHAAIHAGAVGLVTGSVTLALAEFAAHAVIDDAKCAGRIGFNTDQALHIACKALWAGVAVALG